LLDGSYTLDHVVPRWIQRRYNLWDQKLGLLNQTELPYRQLTVPCCVDCNSYHLKPLEDSLHQTVDKGLSAVAALGKKLLFLWLGKLLFGILYKELLLFLDRSDNQSGTIVTPQELRAYDMHRLLLQEVRGVVRFNESHPGSIFVFSMQPLTDRSQEWDLCDFPERLFIACRVGRVAILGVLGDGGAQQSMEPIYEPFMQMDLHPIQFRELCAHFAYRSTLATRHPAYAIHSRPPHEVIQLPLGGFSAKPLFDEWDWTTYFKFLSFYTGQKHVESVYSDTGKVVSWLNDGEGRPRYMDFRKEPYIPARNWRLNE
jgi:hypothetical protein